MLKNAIANLDVDRSTNNSRSVFRGKVRKMLQKCGRKHKARKFTDRSHSTCIQCIPISVSHFMCYHFKLDVSRFLLVRQSDRSLTLGRLATVMKWKNHTHTRTVFSKCQCDACLVLLFACYAEINNRITKCERNGRTEERKEACWTNERTRKKHIGKHFRCINKVYRLFKWKVQVDVGVGVGNGGWADKTNWCWRSEAKQQWNRKVSLHWGDGTECCGKPSMKLRDMGSWMK